MAAYTELQQAEFSSEREGYTATRHQREVGAGYFDLVTEAVSGGEASTKALVGSTESAQFQDSDRLVAAHEGFEQEHVLVERMVARMKASKNPAAMVAALDELEQFLTGHFAREESPQGLYGLVRKRAPQLRNAFDALMAEHGRLLEQMKSLRAKAQDSTGAAAALEADRLGSALREHEERENEIVRTAVSPQPAYPAASESTQQLH
jgi:hypothetical protein